MDGGAIAGARYNPATANRGGLPSCNMGSNPVKHILRDLWYYKSTVIMILTPLLLLPLPLVIGTSEANCAYVVILMGIYWMTEVVPLPVTALMPVFMFPALGVLPSKKVAINYMKDTNFLFMGGLIIAVAVEQCNLHQRIALRVLTIVGSKPKWLMIGFMSTTWFLSMWISNTATTAMMLPIVQAVCVELIKQKRKTAALEGGHHTKEDMILISETGGQMEQISDPTKQPIRDDESIEDVLKLNRLTKDEIGLCRCLLLSIAYAANVGGTGTLTGTPPNIVMTGILNGMYGDGMPITFASWMAFSLPGAVINLFLAWAWLMFFFLGWRVVLGLSKEKEDPAVRKILRDRYTALGRVTFAEAEVLCLFVFLVLLWLLRRPGFMPGWGSLFEKGFMSDGVAAIFIAFFLFFLPFERPDWLCSRGRDPNRPPRLSKPLLQWDIMQKKFPWGIVILLGGGFALGNAVQASGLSNLIGDQLESLSFMSTTALCAISVVMMTFLTEVTSNTATASIFIPILTAVAEKLQVNPLYFVLAITVCASYAFMLPVATPPNAIVFGAGILRVIDMMIVGFMMNWLGIGVMLLSINTWTYHMFNLGEYPAWAPMRADNATLLL